MNPNIVTIISIPMFLFAFPSIDDTIDCRVVRVAQTREWCRNVKNRVRTETACVSQRAAPLCVVSPSLILWIINLGWRATRRTRQKASLVFWIMPDAATLGRHEDFPRETKPHSTETVQQWFFRTASDTLYVSISSEVSSLRECNESGCHTVPKS